MNTQPTPTWRAARPAIPATPRAIATTVIATALLGVAPGQQKIPIAETLRAFRGFDVDVQRSIVRGLERKIQLDPNPEIQRIVGFRRDHGKLPVRPPLDYHRAELWAKGVAPTRKVVPATDPRHRTMRDKFPHRPFLPNLIKAVEYHWPTGRIVRRAKPLSPLERFTNILRGFPPGSDDAAARLLADFDNDRRSRPIAAYLGHQYADLDGRVYAGITLYEAWYSGQIMDCPDVDSVPFAVQLLQTKAFKSPIPAGPARTALYGQIRDVAFIYRKYRTLREAAAAAFLHVEPDLDPTYAPLIPRLRGLFVAMGDDVAKVRAILVEHKDRDAVITAVDAKLRLAKASAGAREARRKNLANMHAWLRYWAQLAVFEQSKRDKRQLP